MADFLCGLDLGQSGDYTALAILRRSLAIKDDGLPMRSLRGDFLFRFECVHLQRFKLGTSYPAIVAATKDIVRRPQLCGNPRLAIDATGVGRAVVDLFLNERLAADIVPVTITAGDTARRDRWNYSNVLGCWVPKNELVSSIRANLESGRLKVAKGLAEADTLKRELLDFKVKITKAANETFMAREGAHDDLVLATAMAVWLGEQRETHYVMPEKVEVGPNTREVSAGVEELRQEAAAVAKEQADDLEKQEAVWRDPFADHWYGDTPGW